jgi:hypothetical protein
MKKLSLLFVTVVGVGLLTGCNKKPAGTPAPTPRVKKVDTHVNEEPLASRPYVRLIPRADAHAITVSVEELKKKSAELEYEVEYNSGPLLQGAFGTIDLAKGSTPFSKEILLGSCSTGGKCAYNADVTGGTMTLRFGNPDYTLKQEWSFTEKAKAQKEFSSRDAKFTLNTSKAKNSASVVVVYQTPGYPGTISKDVVAGPYTVSSAGDITGTVSISMHLSTDDKATIMSWDGSAWKELSTTTADRTATAQGSMASVFIAVKK